MEGPGSGGSGTVFRDYSASDAVRSDRSAGDRHRHRQKVREAIRENIADVIAEESIIGRRGDRIIKVPIRGVKEYRFVYGPNTPGVGAGDGDTDRGDRIGDARRRRGGPEPGPAGDQPGADYYETDVSLEELVDIMFEDLELPEMERKRFREIPTEVQRKRKGFRRAGVRTHLDKRRTAKSRIRRKVARSVRDRENGGEGARAATGQDEERRFPFHREDLIYRRMVRDERPHSNAVVLCVMDTSGSMDRMKKYLARSFFFLLYQFVRTRYRNVELAFIAHHTEAREVSEEDFFHKAESGGTLISSGYRKALEIIQDRFHPSLWNVYAFHCSDGDNWPHDTPEAIDAARELCEIANLFGYGEIKPLNSRHYGSSLLEDFKGLVAPNFQAVKIERKEDLWPSFRSLLSREQTPSPAE